MVSVFCSLNAAIKSHARYSTRWRIIGCSSDQLKLVVMSFASSIVPSVAMVVSLWPQVAGLPRHLPQILPPGEGGRGPVKGAEGACEALDGEGRALLFLVHVPGAKRLLDISMHK